MPVRRSVRIVLAPSLLFAAANLAAQDAPPNQSAPAPTPAWSMSLLSDLEARAIGPAVCGGRIGAVAAIPGDPRIVWVGAASGGVWKSTDGGVRFTPVFDDQDVTSIGAIAIDPRSPEVVWVGTGEGNPRNSASVGRGIYRTRDGGRSWQKLGLDATERIHRILLHPQQPDTAWVAAFGTSWGENEQRGVFKTTDGGATWQKVLHVDARTGCGDLAIDPHNPDKLFAAMWEHRRWPWSFRSGGPGSGLYRSLDGGASWTRLDDSHGLPEGELGRIGIAIAPSDPQRVYALVEAEKSVLLRSDDGGFRFRVVDDGEDVNPRPFYYCDLRVDPLDANRLYRLQTVVDVSEDGGRTFRTLAGWDAAHPDHHAMWIDPLDPKRILIGNDGGVYHTTDRGSSWRFCGNLPLAQFYHVAVDDQVPYHVYGGLQDNGSWRGPSTVWENGGIRNLHWQEVCFGDGFATVPDPADPRQGYAMSQGGALVRWDLRTGSRKSIQPRLDSDEPKLRFHWNAAIALDPFASATVFYGSQFVHRSDDRGETWRVISPDLTTNDPEKQRQDESGGLTLDVTAAENHCTILTIAPSPRERGVLWVGTDDGRVHVTRDGGDSWRSVERRIPGLPANTWCPHIEASPHDAATAFAVFDGHRTADWTPYVYVTRDFGETWVSLATSAIDGYCLVIEQDPVQPDLLWVGTEFGLFVTFDGGKQWHPWRHVPACSAMALVTHPRDGDLVVGTHGRSIFVVDDITPLRTLTPELLQQKLHVFPVQPAIQHEVAQSPGSRFPGHDEFRGAVRKRGVLLHVITNADELEHPDAEQERARQQAKRAAAKAAAPSETTKAGEKPAEKPAEQPADRPAATDAEKAADKDANDDAPRGSDEPKDKVTIEVRDATGALVRTFRHQVHLGLNRIVWEFERDGAPRPSRELREDPELPPPGREVLPGSYELTVRFQGESRTVTVEVRPDPRIEIPLADRIAKDELRAAREQVLAELHRCTKPLARVAKELELVRQRLALDPKPKQGDDPLATVRDALRTVDEAHKALLDQLWGPKQKQQGIVRGEDGLIAATMNAMRVSGTDDAPNAAERTGVARAQQKAKEVQQQVAAFFAGPLTTFRAALATAGFDLLPKLDDAPAERR